MLVQNLEENLQEERNIIKKRYIRGRFIGSYDYNRRKDEEATNNDATSEG